jgi:riboflavin-specific deaminase-like protein
MVGSGTALSDNPLLTARNVPVARQALRVVVDSSLRLPLDCRLVDTAAEQPCLIWTGPEADPEKARLLRQRGVEVIVCEAPDRQRRLKKLLQHLAGEKNATNVLVEGGAQLLGGLLDTRLIDQCEVFVAPRLIGGTSGLPAMAGLGFATVGESLPCEAMVARACGRDIQVSVRVASQPENS